MLLGVMLFNLCHVCNVRRLAIKFLVLTVLDISLTDCLDGGETGCNDGGTPRHQERARARHQLKKEMNAAHKSTIWQFSKKFGSSTYEFRRKGNEHQFDFNCGIEDAIDNAKSELSKVKAQITTPRRL